VQARVMLTLARLVACILYRRRTVRVRIRFLRDGTLVAGSLARVIVCAALAHPVAVLEVGRHSGVPLRHHLVKKREERCYTNVMVVLE
jgi:hypothetical protein